MGVDSDIFFINFLGYNEDNASEVKTMSIIFISVIPSTTIRWVFFKF